MKEYAASIVRVEVCRIRNWFTYTYRRLQEKVGHSDPRVGLNLEPVSSFVHFNSEHGEIIFS
jgi:hypothetical protein